MYNDLKSAIEFFKNDKFAASTGVEILSVETGRAVCALEISPVHVNSDGSCRAGQSSRLPIPLSPLPQILVQRTIAASLPHKVISISFRQPPREGLVAEAVCVRDGHSVSVYRVTVSDETNNPIAFATFTGYKVKK